MRGKMIIHACGGAGINITADIIEELRTLGSSFSEVEVNSLDTTDKTVSKYSSLTESFLKVTSKRFSKEALDGMSGERKDVGLVKDIEENIKPYVDSIKPNKNEYHVIINSASGGSGSIIGSLLFKYMRAKDLTTIPVVVGDESNLLAVTNTINTLVGLNKLAKLTNTAQGIVYFSNSIQGSTSPKSEKEVNRNILRYLSLVSMFISGTMQDIDHQDMNNFFIPTRYKSFTVEPGIYKLGTKIGILDDYNAILARTALLPSIKDYKIEVPLLHNKVGVITEEHKEIFGDKVFPLYLTFKKNELNTDLENLSYRHKELEKLKVTQSSTFDQLEDSLEDDGLVL